MEHHQNKTVSLTIDGFPVTVPSGTTILEAAKKINVNIPTLCQYHELCKPALCRLCVVECDGRGKLMAACATEVSEGVKVETNTFRILNIRKTILELLLANHPDECLSCVKNQNCELQKFAIIYGVRGSAYRHVGKPKPRKVSAETITLDMGKCVKCGRCAEVCQEYQKVGAINSAYRSNDYRISTPYARDLNDGPCVFCGKCVSVCPVGAVYHHDQSAEVRAELDRSEQYAAAQISPTAAQALAAAAGFPEGSITTGKIISALKTLGFKKVYDTDVFADLAIQEKARILAEHLKKKNKNPVITSCTPGWMNLLKNAYPDLIDNHPSCKNYVQTFNSVIRNQPGEAGTTPEKITTVSVTPCLAKKYGAKYTLIPAEFLQLLFTKGIEIRNQPESSFGIPEQKLPDTDQSFVSLKSALNAKNHEKFNEHEINFEGAKIKILVVNGIANARKIMDSIREGKCDAALVDVRYCGECGDRC